MNRLTILIWFFLFVCAGCISKSHELGDVDVSDRSLGNGAIVEHGVASLPDPIPAQSEAVTQQMNELDNVNALLPSIPRNDLPVKMPSDLTEFWRNGSETYDNSSNAIVNGSKMELYSVDENQAWVIYQIPDLLAMTELIELTVEISGTSFGPPDNGYWIGFANYEEGCWQVKSKSQAIPTKKIFFTTSNPYISPANNFYMFVMITGTQTMTVDRVGLEYNTPAWVEVIVDDDDSDGISTGWMPSIVFDRLDNLMVAYSELGSGKPRLAVGDRLAGLGNQENWSISYIDQFPEDSGEAEPDTGAKAKWLDITLDEFNSMPRVSMIYDEISGKEENSRAGISVMLPDGRWLNYRLGWIDGAEWTSIDSIPGTHVYGVATSAENNNYGVLRFPYDYTYITFDVNNSEHVYDLYRSYGSDWRFPHLRYNPGDGAGVVSVYGSSGYKEGLTPDSWDQFYGDPNSNEFGSLAVNPINSRFGGTYSQVNLSHWELMYVEYDAAFVGSAETVDVLPRPNNVERIGDVSQLAYLPDGTPVVAYTVFDGNFVEIKYAEKVGEVWESQIISSERSLAESLEDRFVVDLAIDSNGVPAVCYRHRSTQGQNSLRVVFNED